MSIIAHVGIVLFLLWLLSFFNRCHPIAFILSLIYLYLVHEKYVMKLRRKLQFEERRQANQKRVLTDSETVRWMNHTVEKIWPIFMEQIASQKILLPIIPWFLKKYKPWTAKEAVVRHMYLGRNPPLFTEMRVLRQSTGDDHLVLELGMNFCTADDMSAILAVKLRKRLGFGIWARMHLTGMHVEGKVLIGVKFLRQWPFIGRLRVCFAEPPYFQMTVKPIFTHGLDVTELPGIAGWLDKLLSVAFEQTLVQPNMLVVDMEKFVSPGSEDWFSVDEKEPVAHAKVEVIEASDLKPSDPNGLADPYVKGQLGAYRFRTKTQRKTLFPRWQEEFKIPICTWESPNVLSIDVRDKDHLFDDALGVCTVDINELKDLGRHDMWLPLQNIKMGRLHLAITVQEQKAQGGDCPPDGDTLTKEKIQDSCASDTVNKASFSSVSSEKSKVPDNFEPINIEGQEETGIWVHHPGSEVSQTWEPRKGKTTSSISANVAESGPLNIDCSSGEESAEGENKRNRFKRGLQKIGSVFHRNSKNEDNLSSINDISPYDNIKATNQREIGVKFLVEDSLSVPNSGTLSEVNLGSEKSSPESPQGGNSKGIAKSILKHAENSARSIKHALSRKGSRRSCADPSVVTERDIFPESESSDDQSLSSLKPTPQPIPVVSSPIPSSTSCNVDSVKPMENIILSGSSEPNIDSGGHMNKVDVDGNQREIGVKFLVEDSQSVPNSGILSEVNLDSEKSSPESPQGGNSKGMSKSILKHAEKPACSIKHALSQTGSRRSCAETEGDIFPDSESSDDQSLSSPQPIPVVSSPIPSSTSCNADSVKPMENIILSGSSEPPINPGGQMKKVVVEGNGLQSSSPQTPSRFGRSKVLPDVKK
uniref:C2 domain-containing protein n=1 Tax=Salix viminalis TaxID=40686 RepID=A0A6N2LFZ9_SALVM